MFVKVLSEQRPESRHHIIKCEVTYWHSFLTRRKDIKQFLVIQEKENGPIKYFECPDMTPILRGEWTTESIQQALHRFFEERENQEATEELREKYEDFFEEPLSGPATYRTPPKE